MRPDAKKKIAAAAPKKGPNPVIIGAVVAVVMIVGVVAAILIGNSGKPAGNVGSALPSGVVATGGGIVANAAAAKANAPTLDIYEDFQCPGCGDLEKRVGADITALAKAGDVKLVLHILSFLDANLKNDSSTRSANATACAADAGKAIEYHSAVFAAQPAQEGVGYTDVQLTEFAGTAGITGDALTTWQTCTSSAQHAKYVADVQTNAEKAAVNSTPTVKLNGQDITKSLLTPDGPASLVAQVKAATK